MRGQESLPSEPEHTPPQGVQPEFDLAGLPQVDQIIFRDLLRRLHDLSQNINTTDLFNLRNVVALAKLVEPDFRLPAGIGEVERLNFQGAAALVAEVGKQVFLPSNRVCVLNFLGDSGELITGTIISDSKREWQYLGRTIRAFNVKWDDQNSPIPARTIECDAFVDFDLARRDAAPMYAILKTFPPVPDPLVTELQRYLRENRITEQEYCEVCGVNRLMTRQRKMAQDHAFCRAGLGEVALERREIEEARFMLRQGCGLHQLLSRTDAHPGKLELVAVGVRQYAAGLSGIVGELESYGARSEGRLGELALWDFLATEFAHFQMSTRIEAAILSLDQLAARFFFNGLADVSGTGTPRGIVEWLKHGSTSAIERAQVCLSHLYAREFYTESERASKIVRL